MSVPLTAEPLVRGQAVRAALPPLLLGLLALGWMFRQEIDNALAVWSNSTAYNHCFLVLPIAAWLAWERRERLYRLPIRSLPMAALATLPLILVWFVSERLGIMEGRQLAALGFVEVLVLTVFGWRFMRGFGAPLIYLVFLVPFGAFLTSTLQDFTAHFVVLGLNILGITNFSDGYTIEIPAGVFYVAEACAGLRFLIAAVAFGVLYAITLYRSLTRRVIFVAISTVVPVLANGVRALGIVVAGNLIGSAEAAVADHLIYGWLFFSFIIIMLILAGLPFREDGVAPMVAQPASLPPPVSRPAVGQMAMLAILIAALAGAAPLLAARLDRVAAAGPVAVPASLAGCEMSGAASVDTALQAVLTRDGAAAQGFLCQGGALRLLTVVFPPRTNPNRFLSVQRGLTQPADADDVSVAPLSAEGAAGWSQVSTHTPAFLSATGLWIEGAPACGGLRSRLMQAARSLRQPEHPVVLAIAEADGAQPLAELIRRANAETGLTHQLMAWSSGVK